MAMEIALIKAGSGALTLGLPDSPELPKTLLKTRLLLNTMIISVENLEKKR